MPNYVKPQTPLYSKENEAYFYPMTTSDQVIMPDGSRLNQEGLEGMITPDGIGALSMELLWENASPTSAFAGGDSNAIIFEELSDNDHYSVDFRVSTNMNIYVRFSAKVGETIFANVALGQYKTQVSRACTSASATKLVFDNGYDQGVVNDAVLIPSRVYVMKGVSE